MPKTAEGAAPVVLWNKIISYRGKKKKKTTYFFSKGIIISHLDHGNANDPNG